MIHGAWELRPHNARGARGFCLNTARGTGDVSPECRSWWQPCGVYESSREWTDEEEEVGEEDQDDEQAEEEYVDG